MSPDALSSVATESETQPWKIPAGWIWTALETVTEPVATIDPRKASDGTFTYIDLSAVHDGSVVEPQVISSENAPSRARQAVRLNDILFSGVRVYLKNIALVDEAHDPAVASTAFCVLRPTEALNPRYLYWFVNSQRFIGSLLPLQRGNSPPAVLDSDTKAQPIPLPPVNEQQRIVARIDELFAEIAEGEAALERARQDLETWRRALLKAAVTGELTRDWREANGPTETGADLLSRILERRRAEWEEQARGQQRRKNRGRYPVPDLPAASAGWEIPEGWVWASLDQLTRGDRPSSYGVLQPGPDVASGIPLIRVGDIHDGHVEISGLKRIATAIAQQYARTRLSGGELLITLVGAIGRTAVAPIELAGANTARAVGVVPLSPLVNPRWVEMWFRSPSKQIEMIGKAHEVARKTLNLEDVRTAGVAIPPRPEQDYIVTIVDGMFDSTDFEIGSSNLDAQGLRQSILKAAFEGRIVPQNPDDEPASMLIARLREANGSPRSGSRRRGRRSNARQEALAL
jgi:type I restriction enzyme S subunit